MHSMCLAAMCDIPGFFEPAEWSRKLQRRACIRVEGGSCLAVLRAICENKLSKEEVKGHGALQFFSCSSKLSCFIIDVLPASCVRRA